MDLRPRRLGAISVACLLVTGCAASPPVPSLSVPLTGSPAASIDLSSARPLPSEAPGEFGIDPDPCYHIGCDDIDNVDLELVAIFAEATRGVIDLLMAGE